MGLHTKKDFAELCGLATKNLATYIGRGSVIVAESGLIDDKIDKNRIFLEKRAGRVTEQQAIKHLASIDNGLATRLDTAPEDEKEGIPPFSVSERRLKFLDAEKREAEVLLLKIKERKIKGSVVPSALMQPVILQHNKSFMEAFKQGADDIIRAITHKKGFTGEERSELNGQLIKIINEGMRRATSTTIATLGSIIDEFCQSRAQGERK